MNFTAKEVVWLRGLLKELFMEMLLSIRLRGNNQSAMMLFRNPVLHKHTKDII